MLGLESYTLLITCYSPVKHLILACDKWQEYQEEAIQGHHSFHVHGSSHTAKLQCVRSIQLGTATSCGLLTKLDSFQLLLVCIDSSQARWAAFVVCTKMWKNGSMNDLWGTAHCRRQCDLCDFTQVLRYDSKPLCYQWYLSRELPLREASALITWAIQTSMPPLVYRNAVVYHYGLIGSALTLLQDADPIGLSLKRLLLLAQLPTWLSARPRFSTRFIMDVCVRHCACFLTVGLSIAGEVTISNSFFLYGEPSQEYCKKLWVESEKN